MLKILFPASLLALTLNCTTSWSTDLPNACGNIKKNGTEWSFSIDGYHFSGTVKNHTKKNPGITISDYGESRERMKGIFLESRIAQQLNLPIDSPDDTPVIVEEATMGTSRNDETPSGVRTDADFVKNKTQTRYQMQLIGVSPSPTYASVFVPHTIETIPLYVLSEAFRLSATQCSSIEVAMDEDYNSNINNIRITNEHLITPVSEYDEDIHVSYLDERHNMEPGCYVSNRNNELKRVYFVNKNYSFMVVDENDITVPVLPDQLNALVGDSGSNMKRAWKNLFQGTDPNPPQNIDEAIQKMRNECKKK